MHSSYNPIWTPSLSHDCHLLKSQYINATTTNYRLPRYKIQLQYAIDRHAVVYITVITRRINDIHTHAYIYIHNLCSISQFEINQIYIESCKTCMETSPWGILAENNNNVPLQGVLHSYMCVCLRTLKGIL